MPICRRNFGKFVLGGLAVRAMALPSRPKLLILVVLEQFRPDYLDTAWPNLAPGGFRRLIEKGSYFPDCRHAASTFSASTVATLATGAWPAQHGIVADYWYDRAAKKAVPASDEALLATTLAAQVAAEPRSRVYVISGSSLQAGLFAAGSDARIFWMDAGGQFATRGGAPGWLTDFNGKNSPETLHGAKWQVAGAKPDAPPLRVLTYDQNHPGGFVALYKSSPFAQSAEFDLLSECIAREGLGQGNTFDFVCVISTAMAQLGYECGARSPLMHQMVLRLDRRLEDLLTLSGRAAGENGFNMAIAGGHGAPPQPTADARHRAAVNGETVAQAVARGLEANSFGSVQSYVYPLLYLDTSGFRDPEAVRLAAARAAMGHAAVAGYYTAGGACSTHDEWERRFRNSFHPKRSGDLLLSYRPEYIEQYGQDRGISYGSLYDYDVRVPLCLYGPQFRAGTFEAPVESVDVAPTLARAIGVAPPSSSTGRVLGEAFAE